MAGDFEEKYLLLRDENLALKKKKNEQEATIKRMYTKLAIIEEAMKKKRLATDDPDNQEEPDTTTTGGIPIRRDLETEKFVQALKSENAQLRKKNQMLMDKNRQLEEKMRQHQLKYHSNPKVPSASATNVSLTARKAVKNSTSKVHAMAAKRAVGYAADGESLEKQINHARRTHRDHLAGDLEMALKNRLVIAEKQVVKLQQENEQLRATSTKRLGTQRRRTSGGNNNTLSDGDESEDDRMVGGMDVEHLRRELRDRQAQVAILNARYENLEANAAAEREIQEQTIEQLEHMNRQVHKLRSQLHDTSLEKEELEVRLAKSSDMEHEMAMLRDQNRKLEERMTSLCESPFINDAFQRKERIDKLFDLEKLTQEQKGTITRMTEENQKLQVIVKESQSNVKLMKQAKEMVERDMDKLHQQLVEERNARSIAAMTTVPVLTIQPNTRAPSPKRPSPIATHIAIQPDRRDVASSPLKGEQPAQFSNALSAMPMVTRRYPDPTIAGSLALYDPEGPEANSVKDLRNRIHVLQLAHLKAIQELERCEKMLHAQTNINHELAQEIEELTTKNVSSSGALQKRLKQLEISVEEKQQRIQLLEAQNRQLKYAREKLVKDQGSDRKITDYGSSSDEEDDANEVASVSESLVMAARDLSPGEQLLEIWIVGATFDRSVISTNASTFVLCDFYDFESQSTPLLVGHRPEYNFSSMFKVTVDAFFLRYLASEILVFELHQAIQGDFRLVGRASVPLYTLLRSKGVIKDPELPIKLAYGAEHDTIVGSLNVALRFAAPISEIWKLHLRSYPQDVQLLSRNRLSSRNADPVEGYAYEDGFEENQLKAVNELQITVFACRGLRSFGKKKTGNGDDTRILSTKPSSYVHYQILGFPDMFTNIVPSTSSPEFDLHTSKQFFTVEVDACLLQFFSKFQLWFTVFDDQVDIEGDNATDGAIGRCGILLEEITKGESLRGWFQLRDRNDQSAGEISILIEWKDPFQVAQLYSSTRRVGSSHKTADLHSLDYDQQHAIMRLFAPDMDGRVNYRQFLTYALPPESLELVTSKIKERLEYAIDTEQIQSIEDIFAPGLNDPSARLRNELLKEISPIELQKRLERYGVFMKEEELGLVEQVFSNRSHTKQNTETRMIQVHYLIQHINPRFTCAERLLLHKIRHTLRVATRGEKGNKTVLSPSQPFERYDPAQSGFVSRAEFKRSLGVLGFELLDIDKAYKEFVEKETRSAGSKQASQEDTTKKPTVHLDEETLTAKVPTQAPTKISQSTGAELATSGKKSNALSKNDSSTQSKSVPPCAAIDPRSEFDRRKELFLERMKAIASSSAKSSVYEQLEKQKGDRRAQTERSLRGVDMTTKAPLSARVEQQINQLHVPKALHHDAAKILQRQFRHYRMRHATAAKASTVHVPSSSIVEIDAQLARMLKPWTRDELETLESTMIETIESEFPNARKDRFISRKQLGFVLSKIPRIAFDPELLRQLTRHFSTPTKAEHGDVAYRPLAHFLCTVVTEHKNAERPPIPLMKAISRMYVDVWHVHETFMLVGDVNGSGRMTIKRFHEAVDRVGLRFAAKDLRLLTVLLSDTKGVDILYSPLLKLLRDSPVAVQLRQVISRCSRYGVAKLREVLISRISTDDGQITREQLHSVLMQENVEVTRFEPSDSYVLVEMMQTENPGGSTQGGRVSIDKLVLAMERLAGNLEIPLNDDALGLYQLPQLQRLAMSTRSLLCPPYASMVEEFARFDWKETGLVTLAEFVTVVPRIGFVLFTNQQVNVLAKNFGAKVKGTFGINYRQFLDWTTPSATPPDIESIEAKLRRVVADQSSETNHIAVILTKWRDTFARVDKLSSGFITRLEFASVCTDSLKLPLTTEELRTLLFNYDRNMDDRVDYGAFVQLNWKETSRQTATQQRKQVQFEGVQSSLPDALARLHKALFANHVTVDDIARVLTTGERNADVVSATQFIVSLKQLGVTVTPADAEMIINAHADPAPNGRQKKLRLVHFMESKLGLPSRKSANKETQSSLSKDEEDRLQTAVTSALKYSRKDVERACAHFEEFCVVYDYGDIPSRKLWNHFERNGLTSLLSKKGTGLLIQKFSVRNHERDEKGSDESNTETVCVSLRSVSRYLQDALAQQPAMTHSDESTETSPLSNALAVIRQLVSTCDANDKDVRAAFEDVDLHYTGTVPALEFKSILLEAGWTKTVQQSKCSVPSETLIGLLVREFRSSNTTGGVSYATLIACAASIQAPHPLNSWVHTFAETLRSRIRLKAGLKGPISTTQPIEELCSCLDSAFAHFDQQKTRFLTQNEISAGLRALKYDLSSEQITHFVTTTAVFRHTGGNGGLSRMEFDAFVLDPAAALFLQRMADLLYQSSAEDQRIPRVAQLSRLFIGRDQPEHWGVLSASTAWATIQEVTHEELTTRDQRRLRILFDVNRDGMFAYKLFMKVMSQWHRAPVDQARVTEDSRLAQTTETRRASSTHPATNFQCSREDVLRSLYNQLSSIDFNSQIDIFTEYLRRHEGSRGYISASDFESVMTRIGLRLSADGLACLHASYGSKELADINYRAVLKAIRRLDDSQDDS